MTSLTTGPGHGAVHRAPERGAPWWVAAARRSWVLGPPVLLGALAGLHAVVRAVPGRFWTNQDFAVYYAHGRAVREGLAIYGPVPGTGMPFTYPPFAAYVLAAFTFLTYPAATWVMAILSVVALVVVAWLLLGACGLRRWRRAGFACLLAGVALWWEPVQFDLLLGQVNLLVVLLVVADLTRGPGSRLRGAGVGLAAGLKLTPGLFVVYLLLTGQLRAFWTSVATFSLTVALGAALDPTGSLAFWRGGFAGSSIADVTPASFVANQSLRGLVVRSLARDDGAAVTAWWLLLAAAAAALGLVAARRAHRAGDELLATACVGLVTVLVSPISWSHHWVWVVVVVVAFLSAAHRRGLLRAPRGQLLAALSAAGFAALLATWPGERRGVRQPAGLIWDQPWSSSPGGDRPEFRWTLTQALAGNSYVLLACLLLLLALALSRRGAVRRADEVSRMDR